MAQQFEGSNTGLLNLSVNFRYLSKKEKKKRCCEKESYRQSKNFRDLVFIQSMLSTF